MLFDKFTSERGIFISQDSFDEVLVVRLFVYSTRSPDSDFYGANVVTTFAFTMQQSRSFVPNDTVQTISVR